VFSDLKAQAGLDAAGEKTRVTWLMQDQTRYTPGRAQLPPFLNSLAAAAFCDVDLAGSCSTNTRVDAE
jgi:hypothetical protein